MIDLLSYTETYFQWKIWFGVAMIGVACVSVLALTVIWIVSIIKIFIKQRKINKYGRKVKK